MFNVSTSTPPRGSCSVACGARAIAGVPLAEAARGFAAATTLPLRVLALQAPSATREPSDPGDGHHDAALTQALQRPSSPSAALDLNVRRGEIYGFLGRNGAGKTTTIRMLLGLIRPSDGRSRYSAGPCGRADDVFARVGYLVETASAYANLTARENLDIQRRLTNAPGGGRGRRRAHASGEHAERRAGVLSLGNKQRLRLQGLLHAARPARPRRTGHRPRPAGIVEDPRAAASPRRQPNRRHRLHFQPHPSPRSPTSRTALSASCTRAVCSKRSTAIGLPPTAVYWSSVRLAEPTPAARLCGSRFRAGSTGRRRTAPSSTPRRTAEIARCSSEAGSTSTGYAPSKRTSKTPPPADGGGVQ